MTETEISDLEKEIFKLREDSDILNWLLENGDAHSKKGSTAVFSKTREKVIFAFRYWCSKEEIRSNLLEAMAQGRSVEEYEIPAFLRKNRQTDEKQKLTIEEQLVLFPEKPTVNEAALNTLLLVLACEQSELHDVPDRYLHAYPEWIQRVEALKNIIWRFRFKKAMSLGYGS